MFLTFAGQSFNVNCLFRAAGSIPVERQLGRQANEG